MSRFVVYPDAWYISEAKVQSLDDKLVNDIEQKGHAVRPHQPPSDYVPTVELPGPPEAKREHHKLVPQIRKGPRTKSRLPRDENGRIVAG